MIQPSPFEAQVLLLSRSGEIEAELNKIRLIQSLKPDSTNSPGWRARSAAWVSRTIFRTEPCAGVQTPRTVA